jgi:RHS repeat-associated protein
VRPTVTSAVTATRNLTTTYTVDPLRGVATDRSGGPGCPTCGGPGNQLHKTYDGYLNVTRIVDGENGCTEMTYDASGNVMTKTEGQLFVSSSNSCQDTDVTRSTVFGPYSAFNFPTSISVPSVFPSTTACGNAHPNRITNLSYYPNGDLKFETVTGCNGPNSDGFFSYVTGRTYDAHGRVLTVDGPRSGTIDKTIVEYYPDTDPSELPDNLGRLKTITDSLGNTTTFTEYDYFGNIKKVVDPNNVERDYTYDGRDRVTEIRIKGSPDNITQYEYDSVGRMYRLKRPNCIALSCTYSFQYGYDTVNRVTEIKDAAGNTIVYEYDKQGNRTREEFKDTSSVKQRFTNFKYDNFNRLEYVYFNEGPPVPPTAGSIFYKYVYNGDGTVESELDPRQHLTSYDYDELKRLKSQTQTVSTVPLVTRYEYDSLDGVTKVTDPRGIETIYTNGDLGWRLKDESPDAGTTLYQSYDEAGNLLVSQDARGYSTTRTYDGLDHLLTTTYADTSLNVTNAYGTSATDFKKGRLASVTVGPTTAPASVSTFKYDRRGLLTSEQKSMGGLTYTTGYSYDPSGNLLELTYPTSDPSVRQEKITYTYDTSTERLGSISSLANGTTTSIATGFQYTPFGPRTHVTFGNTLADTRTYDYRYRLGTWTLGNLLDYTHAYDDTSNLTGRTDNKTSANTRAYEYDEINRLNCGAGPWAPGTACSGSIAYTYDGNGNRLSSNETTPATTYTYGSSNNRLSSTTRNGVTTIYGYDSDGNITSDGHHSYHYNQANRLDTVDSGPTATYSYDGDNRRDTKSASGTTMLFFYDQSGRLLTQVTPGTQGGVGEGADYIYSDDGPIARVDWSVIEQPLGEVLSAYKSSSNVHLDWTAYTPSSDPFVVRRKQVVDTDDKTFDGATAIAFTSGSTKTYDDPIVGSNRYDYRVSKKGTSNLVRYYHTDHLQTPILLTDGSGAPLWQAEHFPFGAVFLNPVATVENNLRFPGQYFDQETGLHQNWFRDYDPAVGRYRESDLIGLEGGINTYAYVESNPQAFVDIAGLARGELIYMSPRPGSDFPYHVAFDQGNGLALMQTRGLIRSVKLADYLKITGYGIAGYGDIRDLISADEFENNILKAAKALESAPDTACVDVPNVGFGLLLGDIKKAIRLDYLSDPVGYLRHSPKGPADPFFFRRNTTFQIYWKNTGRWHK